MNDYMKALHQRFFREPACTDVRDEIERLRRELREQMDRQDREKLLKLVDLGIELREETSLAAFTAGFRLPWESPKNWSPTPLRTRKRNGPAENRTL